MLIVKNPLDNVSELILSYENKHGLQIPEQLRFFLMRYNGGMTPRTKIKTKNVSTDIRCLYGFSTDRDNYENIRCVEKNGIRLLPIGKDSFGNEFLIEIDCAGKIYYMDHEKKGEIVTVANSFVDFIKICSSEKISDASKRTPKEREQIMIKNGKEKNISDGLREMWKDEYNKYSKMNQEEVLL